jgi:DNA-binding transcriptional ArsR family regulator
MVESVYDLDRIFHALGDPVRRSIIRDLARSPRTVSDLAGKFEDITLAAVSKHIKVLERARIVRNERRARFRYVTLNPLALREADRWIERHTKFWTVQLQSMKQFVEDREKR